MILKNHFQNAYVTADIDLAVAIFKEQFGITREPMQIEAVQKMRTPDGEGEGKLKLAFIQVGALQYELIQPVSGNVALYADAVRPGQLVTFHHVAMRTDGEAFEAVRAESEKHGRRVALEGEANGLRYMYVDARPTLGHYLEYVDAPQAFWDSMKPKPR